MKNATSADDIGCPGRRGITLKEVLVVIGILGILLALLLPAIQSSREAARRSQCTSNLRQIGIAIETYQSTHGAYPGAYMRWAAQILPQLEQHAVYEVIQREDETNIIDVEARSAVPVYICPSDSVADLQRGWQPSYRMNNGFWHVKNCGNGFYAVCKAPYGPLQADKQYRQTRPADISDGQSYTAAVSEKLCSPPRHERPERAYERPDLWIRLMRKTIPVTKPDEMDEFARRCETEPLAVGPDYFLNQHDLGELLNETYEHVLPPNRNSCFNGDITPFVHWTAVTATSLHENGVNLLFADGAVKFVGDDVDRDIWRAYGTRNGGETIGSNR
jgi:prepilin-type processing-associated H-X9-DG protein